MTTGTVHPPRPDEDEYHLNFEHLAGPPAPGTRRYQVVRITYVDIRDDDLDLLFDNAHDIAVEECDTDHPESVRATDLALEWLDSARASSHAAEAVGGLVFHDQDLGNFAGVEEEHFAGIIVTPRVPREPARAGRERAITRRRPQVGGVPREQG